MSIINFNGVWKLNLEKSNIPPVTKSQTLTIETDGYNVTMLEELINDKNECLSITLSGKFDAQDNRVSGTSFADTVSYRLLDSHTIEGIAKKNGKICVKETAILSEDRNNVSVTYLSFDEQGNTIENYGFFERVEKNTIK